LAKQEAKIEWFPFFSGHAVQREEMRSV